MVIRMKHHVTAFVAGGALVGIAAIALAYAVTAASGGPQISTDPPAGAPVLVARSAQRSDIANLEPRAVTADGKLGVYVGSDRSGNAMVAFGGPEFTTPFVRLQAIVGQKDLELLSTAGGSNRTQVDFADVVGVVSSRVARVEVTTAGGKQVDMLPDRSAFAYSAASPGDFAVKVTAYGPSGMTLASKTITAPTPLGDE